MKCWILKIFSRTRAELVQYLQRKVLTTSRKICQEIWNDRSKITLFLCLLRATSIFRAKQCTNQSVQPNEKTLASNTSNNFNFTWTLEFHHGIDTMILSIYSQSKHTNFCLLYLYMNFVNLKIKNHHQWGFWACFKIKTHLKLRSTQRYYPKPKKSTPWWKE